MYRITCTCILLCFLGALACGFFSVDNPLRVATEALNIHLVSCILYLGLYVAFKKLIVQQEEEMAKKTKEELVDRMKEAEQKDIIEVNRAAWEERKIQNQTEHLQNETQLVRERAAAEAAARADPAVPTIPAAIPAVTAGPPERRYREVSSLHPGLISIENSPEELHTFEINF